MLISVLSALWGCIPELAGDCQDMTNASSTYLSLLIGAIVGGTVSWWIFKRQKITSEKQDIAIKRIETLNENHERLLKRMERIEQNHQKTLNAIYELKRKWSDRMRLRMKNLLHDKIGQKIELSKSGWGVPGGLWQETKH